MVYFVCTLFLWICKCFSASTKFYQVVFFVGIQHIRVFKAPAAVVSSTSWFSYSGKRYSQVYITVFFFLYSVCDNLIIDVGLHGCLEPIWKRTFSPRWSKKVPFGAFMYAYIRRYEYFTFWTRLNGRRRSTAHEFPSHYDKCCKVTCFVFIGNHLYCFLQSA